MTTPTPTKPTVCDAWADQAETADIEDPGNGYVAAGWTPAGIKPPRQYFNWILNWLANGIRYFSRRGLVDYDPNETYLVGDIVRGDNGLIFQSAQNANTGNTPSPNFPTWWQSAGVPTPASTDNGVSIPNTEWVVSYAVKIGTALSAQPGTVTSGQVPLAAVQQYQGYLEIAWGQLTGTKNADQLEGRVLAAVATVVGGAIPIYDSSGYLYAAYFNQTSPINENPPVSQIIVTTATDDYQRKAGADWVLAHMMMSDAVVLQADPGGTPANSTPGTLVAYY